MVTARQDPDTPSTKRKRVTRRPEERLEELLAAADHVFAAKPYSKVTVADITFAADVAKGTFYLYFDSKDHLVAAKWERYATAQADHAANLLTRAKEDRDWQAMWEDMMESLVDGALSNTALHRIVRSSVNTEALDLCRGATERLVKVLVRCADLAAEDGVFQSADPALTARLLYYAADGVLRDAVQGDATPNRDALVAGLRELTRKAFEPAPPRVGSHHMPS